MFLDIILDYHHILAFVLPKKHHLLAFTTHPEHPHPQTHPHSHFLSGLFFADEEVFCSHLVTKSVLFNHLIQIFFCFVFLGSIPEVVARNNRQLI